MNEQKTTDQLAEELIAQHFPSNTKSPSAGHQAGNLSDLLPHQMVSVRALVKAALVTGSKLQFNLETGQGKLVPREPRTSLDREILADAVEFEKLVKPGTNVTRRPSELYPWGWCYEDLNTQTSFRRYCQTNVKA